MCTRLQIARRDFKIARIDNFTGIRDDVMAAIGYYNLIKCKNAQAQTKTWRGKHLIFIYFVSY